MSFDLGICPAEPETLGSVGMRTFPELWVSNVGKSVQLVTANRWDLGLGLLEVDEALDSVGLCTHGLDVVGLHSF